MMITRNGNNVDLKAYKQFVLSHPDKPAKFKTYLDWYLSENKVEKREKRPKACNNPR